MTRIDAQANRLTPRITEHNYLQLRALGAAVREEAQRLPPGVVLDLGCGAKPYAALFRPPYIGLDVAMSHGRPDCLGTAEDAPFRNASIATVLSTQHLEHALDPDAVLAEARRVLAPGGTLLLSTHGVWVHHPDPHDYWRWTEEGLRRLFERHGFVVERVHHQGELYLASLLLATYPLGAASHARNPIVRPVARGLLAACNVIGLAVDALTKRLLPRHYASASYLFVGRVPGGKVGA